MTLREELKQLGDNTKKDAKQIYEKVKQYPLISLFFIIAVLLLIALPHWQVSGINNAIEKVTQENQSRATLAQILGGVAIGIGLYYTWRRITIAEEDLKVTQENLKVSQEGQITERFTRAVEQLGAIDQSGNPAIEIRLGGIYALERISTESEKDYWPIMEILTAYVRKNSSIEIEYIKNQNKISLDAQAILTVIKRRRHSSCFGESNYLDLQRVYLRDVNLRRANLQDADFRGTSLQEAKLEGINLRWAKLQGADLQKANLLEADLHGAHFHKANLRGAKLIVAKLIVADLQEADFQGADLREAKLQGADLRGAKLQKANLRWANSSNVDDMKGRIYLRGTDFRGANFEGADLQGVNFQGADLRETEKLTIDQLSKVKTLYDAKLDDELDIPLKEKYPALFEKPDQDET